LFKGLGKCDVVSVLNSFKITLTCSKGDELYKSGMLGIILSGNATIKRLNETGDCITIRTISEGDFFGAASFFGNWKDGMSSVVSKGDSKVIYIDEGTFVELLKKYPQISINYIEYLSDRVRFLNRKLDAFTAKSTEERLYEYLLSQADADGNVLFGFGIAELARRLNVGRTSIYRDISSLESKKMIKRDGHNFKIKK